MTPNPSPDKALEVTEKTEPLNGRCDFSSDGYIQYSLNEDLTDTDQCICTVCVEGTTACDTVALVVDVVEVKIAEDDKEVAL